MSNRVNLATDSQQPSGMKGVNGNFPLKARSAVRPGRLAPAPAGPGKPAYRPVNGRGTGRSPPRRDAETGADASVFSI